MHRRGAEILQGNANDMRDLATDTFAAVRCNATLEHDVYFWKTVAEIRRVTEVQELLTVPFGSFVPAAGAPLCVGAVKGFLREFAVLTGSTRISSPAAPMGPLSGT